MEKIRKEKGKVLLSSLMIGFLIFCSSCSGPGDSTEANASQSSVSSVKKLELYLSMISWKDIYGNGGKCETGLVSADFWFQGSRIAIYDADTGKVLAQTILSSEKDDPESRICTYRATIPVEEVTRYKFVFEGGRLQIEKSLADLKIMANEFPLGDLVFVYELGN